MSLIFKYLPKIPAAEGKTANCFHISPAVHQVELCEALRSSVVALKREKEALCEEQKHHKALGDSIDTMVQDHLKTNEKDKYSVFIGMTSEWRCDKKQKYVIFITHPQQIGFKGPQVSDVSISIFSGKRLNDLGE